MAKPTMTEKKMTELCIEIGGWPTKIVVLNEDKMEGTWTYLRKPAPEGGKRYYDEHDNPEQEEGLYLKEMVRCHDVLEVWFGDRRAWRQDGKLDPQTGEWI